MAGSYMKHDHAIDKFSDLRANYFKYYRFTPRFTVVAIASMIVIPGLCVYTFADQNMKWDWRGKRRDEPLARHA